MARGKRHFDRDEIRLENLPDIVPVSYTHLWFNMVIEQDGVCKKVLESDFIARQQAPEVFDMNASIYAYSREFMQSDTPLSIEGCEYVIMTDTGAVSYTHLTNLEKEDIDRVVAAIEEAIA